MMKLILPTIGTRGDVEPYVALARGLQAAGHVAVVASHPCMGDYVRAYGVEFAPMGPDVDMGAVAAEIRGKSRNWIAGFQRTMAFTWDVLERSQAELMVLCDAADVVVVAHSAAGRIETDLLHKPNVSVTLMAEAVPANNPQAAWYMRAFGYVIGNWVMGPLMTWPYDRLRAKFGLAKQGWDGMTSPVLNMLPVSAAVSPPNPLWAPQHKVTGYWFVNDPVGWQPPAELVAFIESGERPVAISLGAMSLGEADARDTAARVVAAVKQAGLRAVVQGWQAAADLLAAEPTIYHAGSVPHGWLFPQMAAVVHHGGFGTTAAGLRAGVPAVVVPHILDQYLWARKVEQLGVGPAGVARGKLTPARLAAALQTAVESVEMKAAAQQVRDVICAEDGVRTAVGLIEAAVG